MGGGVDPFFDGRGMAGGSIRKEVAVFKDSLDSIHLQVENVLRGLQSRPQEPQELVDFKVVLGDYVQFDSIEAFRIARHWAFLCRCGFGRKAATSMPPYLLAFERSQ